jgi:hypothetical protein
MGWVAEPGLNATDWRRWQVKRDRKAEGGERQGLPEHTFAGEGFELSSCHLHRDNQTLVWFIRKVRNWHPDEWPTEEGSGNNLTEETSFIFRLLGADTKGPSSVHIIWLPIIQQSTLEKQINVWHSKCSTTPFLGEKPADSSHLGRTEYLSQNTMAL